ncbi:TetR/AcrR family transcriptional regulator [Mycobacterium sp. NPDC006124]|uniref:TetR/AcrR family transcriptional regulator n=1 Tax=Mycobacterium sp. NPDC006124 TaxID=3156729 RepID=UPI0033A883AA
MTPNRSAAPLVAADLVEAALRAADGLGRDVADVPVAAIAAEAGMSRSTLLRRLGGSRAALDAAVRVAGVDPGGQPPVRVRALDAAAALISESGLTAATLEAIAARAECSVFSLHASFGGRDGLMRAVFERHSPILDFEEFFGQSHGDLRATVGAFYRVMATALGREPRVVPAMFAETFARPDSPAARSLIGHAGPRMFGVLGRWLGDQIDGGQVRDLPVPLLAQQLMAPMLFHLFTRPAAHEVFPAPLSDVDTVCDVFADAFVRAVGTERTDPDT